MHQSRYSWLVWVVVDELNSFGDVFLDGVQFFLHVTGPYEMCVALQQTAHEMSFLGQIGDERRHKVHCTQ